MSMFGKLADRLLATVAPAAEVDAACVYASTQRIGAGYCPGGDQIQRFKIVTHYDNCAPKVRYTC